MASKTLSMLLASLALSLLLTGSAEAQGLSLGYYSKACPNAEAIVLEEMTKVINVAPSLAGPLLRIHFHDCFAKLEKACPGVVSCADILALVARDVVVLLMAIFPQSKGPYWPVPTGRRDGFASIANETKQLPPPTANITTLISMFASKGLSVKDLVVLSGGHTIGISHCAAFNDRLYNFTGKATPTDIDPTLDKYYLAKLRTICKPNDAVTFVEMDPGSFRTFDTGYYKLVAKSRGVFHSDEALLQHPLTKAYVLSHHAGASSSEFFKDFGDSMINMGNVGVLTGSAGEVRKTCSVVN
ncbi:hypothetical protein BHE74_00037403 [Ensete ventricosum]|nr:hypothetical protein BHE74_00037403 [Ensete ventricosum]